MKIEFQNDQIIITVDASKAAKLQARLSKSGKSRLLASTGGFMSVEGAEGVHGGFGEGYWRREFRTLHRQLQEIDREREHIPSTHVTLHERLQARKKGLRARLDDLHHRASQAGVPTEDLAATNVKKSLTGHGHASKEQVQLSIQGEFQLQSPPKPVDVSDALAIALCAGRHMQHSNG